MKKNNDEYILIFAAYIPPHVGGIERYTSNLTRELVISSYKPIIVTSNYNCDKEFEIVDGVIIIRLPIFNLFKNRYPLIKLNKTKRRLMNILNNYNIKRVIVNTRFHLTTHVGVNYANKRKIPVYLIEHGSNYVTLDNRFLDFFSNRYEDFLTFLLKKRVNGFYGVSDACGNWLRKFNIKASGTWYNSIRFQEDRVLKKKHEGINFFYAGRLIKQKGVLNILISFSNLLSKYNNINLYIAGDGMELDNYKNEFVSDKIHFLGKLDYDELMKYYSICDVFLYPPLWPEGLPTSILEAGMMKCSVIGTNQGGICEIINDNVNGMIVSNDIDDLEKAMEKLLLDRKLREKYANNLYNTVKDKFSWEVTAKKILEDMNLK